MRDLIVRIEQAGKFYTVGHISGLDWQSAVFSYGDDWLNSPDSVPISLSLPLQKTPFSREQTRNYFEGLLPEGFARRSVANWLQKDEEDYLSILSGLGKECLGAIQIIDSEESESARLQYRKLDMEAVRRLAAEGVTESAEYVVASHLSLTGASGKVGLYYDSDQDEWYQPIGLAPSTHIVKQSHVRYSDMVTNEQISLRAASHLGIPVSESFVINTGSGADSEILLASKRYDRIFSEPSSIADGLRIPRRLHQEDFAQALGIPSSEKYEKPGQEYLSRIFQLLYRVSGNPLDDARKLLDLLIFDTLLGNTDNHIKNLSLLYSSDLRIIRLAPAYDLICTLIYPQHTSEMSIAIAGEREVTRIDRDVWCHSSAEIGINPKAIGKEYDRISSGLDEAIRKASAELAEDLPRAREIGEEIIYAIHHFQNR